MRYLLLTVIGWLLALNVSGQNCYEKLMTEALDLIQKGEEELENFALAREKLEAVRSCNDIPRNSDHEALYEQVTNRYIDAITQARDREIAARQLAEANEEKARKQAILTEATRLALISDILLQSEQKTEALFLSFLSRKMTADSATLPVRFTFGQAAQHALREPLHDIASVLTDYRWIGDDGRLALLLDGNRLEIHDPLESTVQHISFPGDTIRYLGNTAGGEYLLIESADHTISCYRQDGQLQATLLGHREGITNVSFSPDKKYILSCSRDNTARIWSIEGAPQALIDGHTGNVYSGQFAPDGQLVLTRSSDGTVKLSDLQGRTVTDITGHRPYVYAATFAPNGQFVLTAAADGYIKIWDLEGREMDAVPAHRGAVRELIVTPDYGNVISRGVDDALKMWDWQGKLAADLGRHEDLITGLTFGRKGGNMISTSMDGQLKIWDRIGKQVIEPLKVPQGGILAADFSPTGSHILTTGANGHIILWDMRGDEFMNIELDEATTHKATFDPQGQYLFFVNKGILYKTPLPATAYELLREGTRFSPEFQQKLVKEYDVLFFDEFK
jgi:hypothetical protein